MGKKISDQQLRTQLGDYLDQLDQGQTHFVIERDDEEVAVLLSMEKFRDILQTLEMLNTLELIDPDPLKADLEFPDLHVLPPLFEPDGLDPANEETAPEANDGSDNNRSRRRNNGSSSIEDVAAKLGIRIIK